MGHRNYSEIEPEESVERERESCFRVLRFVETESIDY